MYRQIRNFAISRQQIIVEIVNFEPLINQEILQLVSLIPIVNLARGAFHLVDSRFRRTLRYQNVPKYRNPINKKPTVLRVSVKNFKCPPVTYKSDSPNVTRKGFVRAYSERHAHESKKIVEMVKDSEHSYCPTKPGIILLTSIDTERCNRSS